MSGTTRTFGPLHFEDLEPRRFEDLVRQLVYDFRPWRELEATGRSGSDDGFDARGFEIIDAGEPLPVDDDRDEELEETPATTDRIWLIQCKRERSITPAKLRNYLSDIPPQSLADLYGMIFVAACDFSKKTRDEFIRWRAANGISEGQIWGKAEIEDQLFQPKNDGLLFAYFGISLRIRRRSVKTELRSRLAIKRKCERILSSLRYQHVLLRDPGDDRYPWVPEPETKTDPGKWRIVKFLEIHPKGIILLSRQFYAYLGEDRKSWDYVETLPMEADEGRDNPWREDNASESHEERHKLDRRAWRFWADIPEGQRAWLEKAFLIKFEDIFDIDEKGDSMAQFPHIYVPIAAPAPTFTLLAPISNYVSGVSNPSEVDRIKFFPDEFPEPEQDPMRKGRFSE